MTLAKGADSRVPFPPARPLRRDVIFKAVRELRGNADWTRPDIAKLDAAIDEAQRDTVEPRPTGLADEAAFFASLRARDGLFPAGMTPAQVDGLKAKLGAFGKACWPISFAAYGFATSYWETGRKMQPCRERGSGDGPDADPWDDYLERYDTGHLAARLGNTPEADGDGVALAGAGDVQLTGASNYRRATAELRKRGIIGPDVDLVKTPALVLRPDISAWIMVLGMEEGWFTGRKLANTLPVDRPATMAEFKASRPIINGTDKAAEIADIAFKWQTALKLGGWA